MELVETLEIDGEEREIADAVARERIDASNVATISGMSYSAEDDEIIINTKMEPNATVADRVNWHNDALNGVYDTMTAVKQKINSNIDGINSNLDTLEFGENSGGNTVLEASEIKDGYYSDTGGNIINNTSFWRTKEYSLAIKPMTTYTINLDVGSVYTIWFADGSKKNIIKYLYEGKNNFYFTTPENAAYLNISGQKSNGIPSKIWLNDGTESKDYEPYIPSVKMLYADVAELKNDLSKQCKKDDITTNETLIGTFNGKNYYRKLFTGISGSGGSVTVNVGGKIEIYNYYGRAYTYGQSGASDVKYPIPNMNYYIESQNSGETSFQLTIPTSSDTRKVDLVIEYTKVDE